MCASGVVTAVGTYAWFGTSGVPWMQGLSKVPSFKACSRSEYSFACCAWLHCYRASTYLVSAFPSRSTSFFPNFFNQRWNVECIVKKIVSPWHDPLRSTGCKTSKSIHLSVLIVQSESHPLVCQMCASRVITAVNSYAWFAAVFWLWFLLVSRCRILFARKLELQCRLTTCKGLSFFL